MSTATQRPYTLCLTVRTTEDAPVPQEHPALQKVLDVLARHHHGQDALYEVHADDSDPDTAAVCLVGITVPVETALAPVAEAGLRGLGVMVDGVGVTGVSVADGRLTYAVRGTARFEFPGGYTATIPVEGR